MESNIDVSGQGLPKVSIITPLFNGEKYVEACLTSVARQTYPCIEHLIIDGCSSDGSLNIVQTYANAHAHIKWISSPDKGIYDAMNKGIALSQGEWLYFMGCDDELYEASTIEQIFTQPHVEILDIIYGNVIFKESKRIHAGAYTLDMFMRDNLCHQSIFTRRRVFDLIGNFELRYKAAADYVFNLNWFANRTITHQYVDNIIAIYNERGFSSNYIEEALMTDKILLFKKLYGSALDLTPVYESIGDLAIRQIRNGNIWSGIGTLAKVLFKTKTPFLYLKNGLYWLKERALRG